MILINHKGTSVISSVNHLKSLVKDVQEKTNTDVHLTFNSKRAIGKLKDKGVLIKTPSSYVSETDEKISIMSAHLFDELCSEDFENYKVLEPLIADATNCLKLSQIILNDIKSDSRLVLVANNTTDKGNHHYKLLKELIRAHHSKINLVLLEDDMPEFSKSEKVIIIPLVTILSHHMDRVLMKKVTSLKTSGINITYKRDGLLAHQMVKQLFVDQIVKNV